MILLKRLNNLAGILYLSIMVSEKYPEQEPAYKAAKWYDLFWLIVPIIGWLYFLIIIETRYERVQRM